MHSVCVLGLGLIGGSVLRAVRAAGYPAWGATASAADAAAALADGYQVESTVDKALAAAAEQDALVVIAAPLPAVDPLLRAVHQHAPACRLTDVVSVKGPVAEAVYRLAPDTRYVGGHPMAGRSESGWAAGSAELFHGAPWVVGVEEDTDLAVWSDVARLALACGAHVVPATAGEHDAAVARVSHLPHVLAAVLAAVAADGGPLGLALAAGSFADGTRVAGSDPELVRAMCEGNRTALLDAVDDALGRLGAARGALASTGALAATLRSGHQARIQWQQGRQAPGDPVEIQLDDPEASTELQELGTRGGRITAVEGGIARGHG